MDIGQLYDQAIADHYDQDEFGLLAGGRGTAFRQLEAHLAGRLATDVLDLAAGTGESLLAIRALLPDARLHGIDLSEKMLAIAREKIAFSAIHDDVAHADRHLAPESVDVILMHYLTTFVDGRRVVADTARLLRPDGLYSIISTTYQAFPRALALGRQLLSEEAIREMVPSPRSGDELAGFLSDAGLEVVAIDSFEKALRFDSFQGFYGWGMRSGFFTHVFERLDPALLTQVSAMEGLFPLEDRYTASIVLARKPA